jgi:hypothetical protein
MFSRLSSPAAGSQSMANAVQKRSNSSARSLPAVPAFQKASASVIQYVKGLKKEEKVKVHKGTSTNAIFSGTILEVINDGQYYKVAPDNGGETISWVEEVVYPSSMPDDKILESSRPPLPSPTLTKEEIPGKEKEILEVKSRYSTLFIQNIQKYIIALKKTGGVGESASFDGQKIFMLKELGAKTREKQAKDLDLRYDKKEKIISFQFKGDIEIIRVEDIIETKTLKSHLEVENNLEGEYLKALSLDGGQELKDLIKEPAVIDLFKKHGKINLGDLGELRAAKRLKTIYDQDHKDNYIILGGVHFWGYELPSTKGKRDISNELDHLVISFIKGKCNVLGLYNTKAGPSQQSGAKKQNANAKTLLDRGMRNELTWKDEPSGDSYQLIQIVGKVQEGPERMLGQEFALEFGNYTMDEGLKMGTIGASNEYDIKLSNSGLLANALTYHFMPKRKTQATPLLIPTNNSLASLEARLRGKALYEADQEDQHEDEFAEWDELWHYLDKSDQELLKAAWEQ